MSTFYFTLYWLDDSKEPHTLTAYHPSEPDVKVNKWIEVEAKNFKDGFVSFLQNFLRTKTLWCHDFVGIDWDLQTATLEPFYGKSVSEHESLLLTCQVEDLQNRLEYEQHEPWYWPFRGIYAIDLHDMLTMIKGEIKRKRKGLSSEKIKILFQF